jgi:drug/metabolite transporter (DMT)-like permease
MLTYSHAFSYWACAREFAGPCLLQSHAREHREMMYLLAIFGLSVLGALADWCLKLSGQRTPIHLGWLSAGALLYLLCAPGWLLVLRRVPFSGIGAPYAVSNVLLLVAIGVLFFHEHLTLSELLGIAFALFSVVLLHRLF